MTNKEDQKKQNDFPSNHCTQAVLAPVPCRVQTGRKNPGGTEPASGAERPSPIRKNPAPPPRPPIRWPAGATWGLHSAARGRGRSGPRARQRTPCPGADHAIPRRPPSATSSPPVHGSRVRRRCGHESAAGDGRGALTTAKSRAVDRRAKTDRVYMISWKLLEN